VIRKELHVKRAALILAALAFAGAASAGEVYGTITESGKPAGAGLALKLACEGASADAKTDAYGAYRVKVAATGNCTLTVASKAGSPSLAVNLYDKPARYDLVLTQSAGKYTVARK
jgi:hypothetical protein